MVTAGIHPSKKKHRHTQISCFRITESSLFSVPVPRVTITRRLALSRFAMCSITGYDLYPKLPSLPKGMTTPYVFASRPGWVMSQMSMEYSNYSSRKRSVHTVWFMMRICISVEATREVQLGWKTRDSFRAA